MHGRRDNIGKIYKLTKFGADWLRNGASKWWWNNYNGFVFILPPFFRFLGQPTGHNFCPICKWLKRCVPIDERGFSGFDAFKFTMTGSPAQKPPIFYPWKSWLDRFLTKNRFNIRAPESKLPLNVKIPQKKLHFYWKLDYKQGIHFSWWWFNRKCTFKMAAAAILNLEKRLPFLYYLTNHCQI